MRTWALEVDYDTRTEDNMIDVDCYNCGSHRRSFYAEENGFTLVKCAECGLLYVTPRPSLEEISAAHRLGVHDGDATLEVTGQFNEYRILAYLRILRDLYGGELRAGQQQLTWLDIGCGHGEFMTAIQEFSGNIVAATGIEPNLHKQASAQARGLNVSYFDLAGHENQYDFLSLLNVYSHLPDPKESLSGWKRLLKPGGELLLETGDTASLSSEEYLRPFKLPDHLSFASQEIVVGILEDIGFEVLAIGKYPYPFVELSGSRFVKELLKLLWPDRQSRIRYFGQKYRTDMFVRARRPSE